jgi:hypothetical protein
MAHRDRDVAETRHTIASKRALLEATVAYLEHSNVSLREMARRALARLFETTAASPEPVLPYLDSLVELLRQKPGGGAAASALLGTRRL